MWTKSVQYRNKDLCYGWEILNRSINNANLGRNSVYISQKYGLYMRTSVRVYLGCAEMFRDIGLRHVKGNFA